MTEPCIACDRPIKPGDRYYPDESGGFIHADCCGGDPQSYTRDGKPLQPCEVLPQPEIWSDDR